MDFLVYYRVSSLLHNPHHNTYYTQHFTFRQWIHDHLVIARAPQFWGVIVRIDILYIWLYAYMFTKAKHARGLPLELGDLFPHLIPNWSTVVFEWLKKHLQTTCVALIKVSSKPKPLFIWLLENQTFWYHPPKDHPDLNLECFHPMAAWPCFRHPC